MEDIVIIEPKDYSHVVFEDIQESYPQDVDMNCLFTINEMLNIDEADFVGIYRVGFKNPKECHSSLPMKTHQIDENRKIKLSITADMLPKDDEYYQLVYVSQGNVRGASIPFQFKPKVEGEKINTHNPEIEALHSKIRLIHTEFAKFENVCDIYENCIEETETLIKSVLLDAMDTKYHEKSLEMSSESDDSEIESEEMSLRLKTRGLLYSLNCSQDKVNELKAELDSIKKKKEDMEIVTDDVTSVLKFDTSLYDEIEQVSLYLEGRTEDMRKMIKNIEEGILKMVSMKHEVKENEMLIMDEFIKFPKKYPEGKKHESMQQEKSLVTLSRSAVIDKYVITSRRLIEAEQAKKCLANRVDILSHELEILKLKSDSAKEETSMSEKKLIEEIKCLVIEMSKLKKDYETRTEEANGSYYALSVANAHLDGRMKTLEDKYKKQIESQNSIIEILKKENEQVQMLIENRDLKLEAMGQKYQAPKQIKQKQRKPEDESQYSLDKDYFQILKHSDSQLENFIKSTIDYNVNRKSVTDQVSHLLNEYESDCDSLIGTNKIKKPWTQRINKGEFDSMSMYESIPSTICSTIYGNASDMNNNETAKDCSCCVCGSNVPGNTKCQCIEHTLSSKCPICTWRFPDHYIQHDVNNHFNCHFAN